MTWPPLFTVLPGLPIPLREKSKSRGGLPGAPGCPITSLLLLTLTFPSRSPYRPSQFLQPAPGPLHRLFPLPGIPLPQTFLRLLPSPPSIFAQMSFLNTTFPDLLFKTAAPFFSPILGSICIFSCTQHFLVAAEFTVFLYCLSACWEVGFRGHGVWSDCSLLPPQWLVHGKCSMFVEYMFK